MAPSNETIAAFRFGYGFRPGEPAPRDAEGLLASLEGGPQSTPDLGGATLTERGARFAAQRELRKINKDVSKNPELKAALKSINEHFADDVRRRIMAPVTSRHGFYERLCWFWADHFSVGTREVLDRCYTGRFEVDAIRPHVAGRFAEMLRATSTHPSMLIFLDQIRSIGPDSRAAMKNEAGLNENLAREIIELHTLGVGSAYTQNDVREFAELLTGLSANIKEGRQVFMPGAAEPGAETVLGVSYGGDGPAKIEDIHRALDDLATHPATARHIARKLAVHFVSDDPSQALVDHVAAAFTRSDGWLPDVYAALLEHPESWSTFGAKVKQPFDFLVSSIRAVGPNEAELARLSRRKGTGQRVDVMLRNMGQTVYLPPGPQGWPETAESWITPQGLAARIEWASILGRMVADRLDPRDFLGMAVRELATEETRFAATRAAERWEGLALVLASPEFNRR